MKRLALTFLISSLAFQQACSEPSKPTLSFGFFQTDSGQWKAAKLTQLQDHLIASKVTCNSENSEIEIFWNAESGDWAAFDKYSSTGPFFSRVIKFSQFNANIQIVKERPDSKLNMRIGDKELKQYDYLLKELSIWTKRKEFPYEVPQCASAIFGQK